MLGAHKNLHKERREEWGKPVRTLTLKKRISFLERADAVRRLQQIGLHRQASLLKTNIFHAHQQPERRIADGRPVH
jgi:hypothetical protein